MVTKTVKLGELLKLEPLVNVDLKGLKDGKCHMTYSPDESTILELAFDDQSTSLLKQKVAAYTRYPRGGAGFDGFGD